MERGPRVTTPGAVSQTDSAESAARTADKPHRGTDGFLGRLELLIIIVLSILAGLRVLVFCAGFPIFNSIDEPLHYDLVYKYSQGHRPVSLEPYSPESIKVLAWHLSPDYLTSEEQIASVGMQPPLTDLPPDEAAGIAKTTADVFASMDNPESTQPPVYYAAAGIWYRLGSLLGFTDVRLAYWIRFLNALVYGLLVWTAYALIRRLFPGDSPLRIGVPLLLAFFPQDVFYGINNDVLSPLLFTTALYLPLRIYLEGSRSYALHAAAGLSVAAVLLTKVSNVTILVPLGLLVFFMLRRARSEGRFRPAAGRIGLMLSVAAIPVILWIVGNYASAGDLSGAGGKIDALGWSYKPIDEVFDHPVFSPGGALTFLTSLTATFWRGEILWHGRPMAMGKADLFYVASTLLFVGSAVVVLLRRRRDVPADERFTRWIGLSALVASVAMLLVLSVIYDFGNCVYPSSVFPFLVSGRLISGTMVPFLVLYVSGLDHLMSLFRLRFSRLAVLLLIVALVTASEMMVNARVFHSPFNWFHI